MDTVKYIDKKARISELEKQLGVVIKDRDSLARSLHATEIDRQLFKEELFLKEVKIEELVERIEDLEIHEKELQDRITDLTHERNLLAQKNEELMASNREIY